MMFSNGPFQVIVQHRHKSVSTPVHTMAHPVTRETYFDWLKQASQGWVMVVETNVKWDADWIMWMEHLDTKEERGHTFLRPPWGPVWDSVYLKVIQKVLATGAVSGATGSGTDSPTGGHSPASNVGDHMGTRQVGQDDIRGNESGT